MNRISPYPLWIGHGGEEHDLVPIYEAGIEAVVELTVEEPPFASPRDLVTCRFPLLDGAGNRPDRLALAVHTVAALLASETPTLVCCGCGTSRAPAVAAAALAEVYGGSPVDWLERVTEHHHSDVSPGLWSEIVTLPRHGAAPAAQPERA
jgi:protein-tyrosine phosphatase